MLPFRRIKLHYYIVRRVRASVLRWTLYIYVSGVVRKRDFVAQLKSICLPRSHSLCECEHCRHCLVTKFRRHDGRQDGSSGRGPFNGGRTLARGASCAAAASRGRLFVSSGILLRAAVITSVSRRIIVASVLGITCRKSVRSFSGLSRAVDPICILRTKLMTFDQGTRHAGSSWSYLG